MSLRSQILAEINEIARDQKLTLAEFDDDSALFSFGLDSFAFLTFVERMTHMCGVDLFDAPEDTELPMTLGSLIDYYEQRA